MSLYRYFKPLAKNLQAEVARYAVSHGNKAAINRYSKEYSVKIKDSSVSTSKSKYVKEFDRKRKAGEFEGNEHVVAHSIPQKKRVGMCLLCRHNFGNNRWLKELGNISE